MEQKNVWETYSTKQLKELEALNEAYRGFLSECKTERECVDYIVNMAEEAGYKELQDIIKKAQPSLHGPNGSCRHSATPVLPEG